MFDALLQYACLLTAWLWPTHDFWLPKQYSDQADFSDWPFMAITWLCIICFVGIVVLMAYFMVRYNRDRGVAADHDAPTHHTTLEITWSAIPLVIVIVIFYVGFKNYMELANPPADAYTIDVTARQWSWSFIYPNGHSTNELHVVAGEPTRLLMKSQDVLHALYVPHFRVKQDIVPGRFSSVWFTARYDQSIEQPDGHGFPSNQHWLFCAEYCGTDHSGMTGTVYVHPDRETYEAWLAKDSDLHGSGAPRHAIGHRLIQVRGCLSCHTLDGTLLIGPSLKDTWREVSTGQRRFYSGPPLDPNQPAFVEQYIQDSIYLPNKQIVDGFRGVPMPTFQGQLSDEDVRAIIEYLKWLAENDGDPWGDWQREQERRRLEGES